MNLRDSIISLLREPGYKPMDETALMRRLDLPKKQRNKLVHELRILLSRGDITLVRGDRFAPAGESEDVVTGKIQFRAGGSAFVIPPTPHGTAKAAPIQIAPDDTGVALHGDTVEVRVSATLSRRRDGRGTERTGRVVHVVERGRDTMVGTLQRIRSTFYVQPDDPRFFHEVVVPDPAKGRLKPPPAAGDKVVVRLGEWTQRNKLIEGEIVETLGLTFQPQAELKAILHKYDLHPHFPAEVVREVASLPDHVRPEQLKGRLDYRDIPTFTIDPDDAKDFDDALSLESLADGHVRIGVHIADVSTYVKPGTTVDKEAQRRGNSTYLVGTVIPMLPEKLSNGLCSLVEAQDRLTKAVLLTFDRKGRLVETDYAATVIRSRKRLTYRQAYALLFENDLRKIRALPLPPKHQTGSTGRALSGLTDLELADLQGWVRKLWTLAAKLRRDRMAHGSLDLDMPETKVFVDKDGYADRLELIEHDESHQLIEEFMLAANEAVARLTKARRQPSLYRVHDAPEEESLAEFRQELATHGIQTGDLTNRAELSKLIETLHNHPQGHTLRTQLLRSLKKACYRATPDGHYGLHKRDYTHFTSPIRRYSDLVVHRVLEQYLIKHAGYPAPDGHRFPHTAANLEGLGEHLSITETNSQEAERESVKVKLLEFFERELAKPKKTVFAAVITDVRQNGLFIELVESMAFGFVPAASLEDDFYVMSPAGDSLVGRKHRRAFTMGQRVDVVVGKVDRAKRLLDFRLA